MDYLRADYKQVDAVASLASLFWHEDDFDGIDDLRAQFKEIISDGNGAVYLCCDGNDAVGFAQFSLRFDYVEGTKARPVGYLEGVYVMEQYRGKGIARQLVRMGEPWAKEKGCTQLASDCELGNTGSLSFHLRSGFAEANRIICFVKDISTAD